MYSTPTHVSFSGHETFPFRYGWMKKAYDAVKHSDEAFHAEDAMSRLGVGKNMVRSMRHWALSAGVIEEQRTTNNRGRRLVPSELGRLLFEGCDPYLEDLGTIWLLHWTICSNQQRSTTWNWAFGRWRDVEFTKDKIVSDLLDLASRQTRTNPTSIRRDVEVFVRTYVSSRASKSALPEDTLDCPLAELGLIAEMTDRMTYRFQRGPQPSLPNALFAFAVLVHWSRHAQGRETLAFEDIAHSPGSPGRVFKLDELSLIARLEAFEGLTGKAIVYGESAGIRQLFRRRQIDPLSLLRGYYSTQTSSAAVAGG